MAARRSMREAETKLSAAIKPYRKYYDFVDVIECDDDDDVFDYHPGDVKNGYTFVGYLITKGIPDTFFDTLLVFKDEDDKYIIGGTIGGMIIPIDLKGALN